MNNEPVAWMMENPQNTSAYLTFEKPTREMKISHQAIPLYTHPAKTPTDEEIFEIYRAVEQNFILTKYKKPDGTYRNFPVELGRAILRKAQE